MRAGGKIGENFLLAKISSCTVFNVHGNFNIKMSHPNLTMTKGLYVVERGREPEGSHSKGTPQEEAEREELAERWSLCFLPGARQRARVRGGPGSHQVISPLSIEQAAGRPGS